MAVEPVGNQSPGAALANRQGQLPLPKLADDNVRKLVLLCYYGSQPGQEGVGYRGPLYDRSPAVPWEGAAPGAPRDSEPIARTAAPMAGPPPAVVARTSIVSAYALPATTDANKMTRVSEALYLLALTPEFAAQK